jgi:hypothetical protein
LGAPDLKVFRNLGGPSVWRSCFETIVYMNSCSCPGPTWSPLVCPLAIGTACPLQRSSFLCLSIVMRMSPSRRRRRPSQIQRLHVSPSTRSNVSATGGAHRLNRVNFANSRTEALEYSLCSLSRPLPPQLRDRNRICSFLLTWHIGALPTPPNLRSRVPDDFYRQPLRGRATSFRCSFKM